MAGVAQLFGKARWAVNTLRRFTVTPDGPARGRVLLSYMHTAVLAHRRGEPADVRHPSYGETLAMVEAWTDLGFTVDLVSFHNRFIPVRRHYDVVIDTRWNLERWAPSLPATTLKVFHADSSHNLQKTHAEHTRLLALQTRRGVSIRPRQAEPFYRGPDVADVITVIGNDVTAATFAYAGRPVLQVPVASPTTYPWDATKDHDVVRDRFVWFGSRGAVLKGLDLVLEVFARNPDLHLTVCGPVANETDLVDAYHRELFELPNIELRGWVDVTTPAFTELAASTIATVYPSASEGQAGAVATCMHAGLIPVCSRESGFDLTPDHGVLLPSCSLDDIEAAVRDLAARPAEELAATARSAWEEARSAHSPEAHAAAYRAVAETLVRDHLTPRTPHLAGGTRAGASSPRS